jgi:Flp pilus assembly protein TadG
MSRNKRRGSAAIEFALVGIPMLCATISIVQMAIAMWRYHTVQFAVKETAVYLSHKGALYLAAGNNSVKIKDVASVLQKSAIGMPPTTLNATFVAYNSSTDFQTVTCRLDACLTNTTNWPPSGYNTPNSSSVSIRADFSLKTAFVMFSPGWRPVPFANAYTMPGYARQMILF